MRITIPQTRRGWILASVGTLVAIVVAWALAAAVYQWLSAPRRAAENKAQAVTQQETTKATGEAAQAALTVTNEVHREYVRIEETTRRNDHAIKQSNDAGTRVPGVAAALHDSLCQRRAYIGEPGCAAVLGNDRGEWSARSDAGGAAPVE